MAATTAVGAVRTYAQIAKNREFDYEAWKKAIRNGNTFVTYGPLLEFGVEGNPAGKKIKMACAGGKVDVSWKVMSSFVKYIRVCHCYSLGLLIGTIIRIISFLIPTSS